jgi:hypothetical protein
VWSLAAPAPLARSVRSNSAGVGVRGLGKPAAKRRAAGPSASVQPDPTAYRARAVARAHASEAFAEARRKHTRVTARQPAEVLSLIATTPATERAVSRYAEDLERLLRSPPARAPPRGEGTVGEQGDCECADCDAVEAPAGAGAAEAAALASTTPARRCVRGRLHRLHTARERAAVAPREEDIPLAAAPATPLPAPHTAFAPHTAHAAHTHDQAHAAHAAHAAYAAETPHAPLSSAPSAPALPSARPAVR